ncbi:MAG: PEP-CTERM sorting domain-containing protein [Planctomycetota bacterium]
MTRTFSLLSIAGAAALVSASATAAPLYSEDFESFSIGDPGPFNAFNISTTGVEFEVAEFPASSGNNVGLISDTSNGTSSNGASNVFITLGPGNALVDEINSILARPVSSAPVPFYFRYDVERFAASDDPLVVNTSIEFLGSDRPTRFPTGEGVLLDDAGSVQTASTYDSDGILELVDANTVQPANSSNDFADFEFLITPSGGADQIDELRLRWTIRVDTGATPETLAIDNIEVGIIPEPASLALLGLGTLGLLGRSRRRA